MEWFLITFVVPILVLGVLVLIHEFGHFIVAKWCGVGVIKFAVGFGPALCKFTRGETTYQIGLIPLGGFVRMIGDMPDMITGELPSDDAVRSEGEAEPKEDPELTPAVKAMLLDRTRWFIEKPLWQRAAVVFAGPLFNLILAFVFSALCAGLYGEERRDERTILGKISKASPAEKAGLRSGDEVILVNGIKPESWDQLATTIHQGTGAPVAITINRPANVAGGEPQQLTLEITPKNIEQREISGKKKRVYIIGISPAMERVDVDFWGALEFGYLWTYQKTAMTYTGLLGMLSGYGSTDDLRGPKFMIEEVQREAERGFEHVMFLTALFSVTLAVLNLLPIPILDGGHLLFFLIEAIFGPISLRKKEMAQQVGLLFLLLLMVIAIKNDFVADDPRKMSAFDAPADEKKDGGSGQEHAPDAVAPSVPQPAQP